MILDICKHHGTHHDNRCNKYIQHSPPEKMLGFNLRVKPLVFYLNIWLVCPSHQNVGSVRARTF